MNQEGIRLVIQKDGAEWDERVGGTRGERKRD